MLGWYARQSAKHAVALVPRWLREPHGLRRRRAMVSAAESWSTERLHAEMLRRLNHTMGWAVRHVPFYRDLEAGGLPIRSFEELRSWPLVERSTVSKRAAEFRSHGFPGWRIRTGQTTGRTGTPLQVRWEWPNALLWEEAFHHRLFRWAGLPEGFRRVVLRGGLVHGPGGAESRWWQVVPHTRTLVLSVFQLSRSTVVRYVQAMVEFRPHALLAYPSAAAKLARVVRERGLTLPPLKAVVTSSERLLPDDRALVEEVIRAPVTDFYGHAERAVAAAQCEHGRYHLFEDYGYAEVVNASGEPVPPGVVGEIVATSFHNRAMPFIRYRTGDRAAVDPCACPCGRVFRVLKILEGRPPECLIGRDGERISIRFGLGGAALRGVDELRFYQIVPGMVEVRYVGDDDPGLGMRLENELRTRTGEAVDYRVTRVDRLPPGPGGKAMLVHDGGLGQ